MSDTKACYKVTGLLVLPDRTSCQLINDKYLSNISEQVYNKTNKLICAPSEDSDQPRHPPSLIRVFAVNFVDC